MDMEIDSYLKKNDWKIIHKLQIPEQRGELSDCSDIKLSQPAKSFLTKAFPKGLYLHQKKAIQYFLEKKNVCLATKAASGKSLAFYVAAIEQLTRNPSAKILAIYPLKALAREQQERWNKALRHAGLNVSVGRIDGQTPVSSRQSIVKECQVLVLTPDIIHAWLLSNLNNNQIVNFLKNISLIIADEIHEYRGVFGSNAAFLFRRIRHVLTLLDSFPQFICASATIYQPKEHLEKLFGVDFVVIGPELDSSPQYEIEVKLINPPAKAELLTEISQLLGYVAYETNSKFICFVDSRKQTELISTIVTRAQIRSEVEEIAFNWDHLEKYNVLPYRAGYEEHDRSIIQERLSQSSLSGVVSTSALELGIDIPYLNLAVLVGVPHSSTSLHQRIGRIGRQSEGKVIVINTGSVYDQSVFRHPDELLKRPLAEGALYLENTRIQYLHALCLARHGGEHDRICSSENIDEENDFSTRINWPPGFTEICKSERVGEIPVDLQSMKTQSGEDPNHTYPLRDIDLQFKVEYKRGPEQRFLGSLSYGQLMREAYPGAIYYYTTLPYRVYKVNTLSRTVHVRSEKRYTTKPIMLPTLVFPNLAPGNIYISKKYNELIAIECNLQVRESISGIKERRGPNEASYTYPLDSVKSGIYFNESRFTRNYFTTGVILTHPVLNNYRVQCDILANLLFEAFLMVVPFERRDVHYASDKHRLERKQIPEGSKFITVYDQTYGSLRLSGRLLEGSVLRDSLEKAIEFASHEEELEINTETINALKDLYHSSKLKPSDYLLETEIKDSKDDKRFIPVIMPGTKGLFTKENNEEYLIERVFYDPREPGLRYRVKNVRSAIENKDEEITIPAKDVVEIPGESKVGYYDYETGEVKSKPK